MPIEATTFTEILVVLKRVMKSKKITYSKLAMKLGMSESGIKKIFSSRDCSLNKLSEICTVLELKFEDVLALIESPSVETKELGLAEQTYFLKHYECFKLFWLLVYDQMALEEIQIKLNIKKAKLYQYLKKLEEFSLIEWLPNDRVKPINSTYVLWKNKGEFIKKIKISWSKSILDDALNEIKGNEAYFSLRYLRLTSRSHDEFTKAVHELILEFEKRSVRELATNDKREISFYRALFTTAKGSFINH